jgi:hypothetical protein
MQAAATFREIALTRPKAVEAAIEILRDFVKDDWIFEPVDRSSADFHPLSVKNK